MTTGASSSLGPVALSTTRSTTRAARCWSAIGVSIGTTAAAAPPEGSAAKDLGRISTIAGRAPSKRVLTIWLAPKIELSTATPPSTVTSRPLEITGTSSFAASRPATSRLV